MWQGRGSNAQKSLFQPISRHPNFRITDRQTDRLKELLGKRLKRGNPEGHDPFYIFSMGYEGGGGHTLKIP